MEIDKQLKDFLADQKAILAEGESADNAFHGALIAKICKIEAKIDDLRDMVTIILANTKKITFNCGPE